MCRISKLKFFAAVGFLSLLNPLAAVPADDNAPVHIRSQTLSGNLSQYMALYQGNVSVTQGTRVLNSDQLYVYTDPKGKVSSVKALGAPVKTHEVVNPQGQMAYGFANEVDYTPPDNMVKYQQNAMLTTNGNVFKGNLITYNTLNHLVLDPTTTPGTIDTFILPPSDQKQKS